MFQLIIGFILGVFVAFGFLSVLICIGGVDIEDSSMGSFDDNSADSLVVIDLDEDRG